jgi:hypothetical protein
MSVAAQALDRHSSTTYHYSRTVGCGAKMEPQKLVLLMGSTSKNPGATPKGFMDKLREIYNRPEMKARFPNGF